MAVTTSAEPAPVPAEPTAFTDRQLLGLVPVLVAVTWLVGRRRDGLLR